MTEHLKQIAEAWGDRIRSPILGSILIFFTLTNWQTLYYLFFADKPVRSRLLYFDANTDNLSLYFWPIVGGVSLAVLVPWISFGGAFLAKLPRSYLHDVQSSEALKRRIVEHRRKSEEEDAKAAEEEARERRKIDAAKRLNEAEEVSTELKSEIEEERKSSSASVAQPLLSHLDVKVLEFASKLQSGRFMVENGALTDASQGKRGMPLSVANSHREEKLLARSLAYLSNNLMLKKVTNFGDGPRYEISTAGYDALEQYKS
ncbi:hypothetical protein [Sulfitobacter sp.]|uniref:hypothetical protein n=1 Tax=Sulfitobacter sp. TaxID=1903071 RepID=UPI00300153B9